MSTTPSTPPSSLLTATADFSSGSSSTSPYPPQHPACSACKHQRRKCAPECPLSPYFPADQPVSFRNAHRLFGIKNILRFLEKAAPKKRDDTMKSMIYEADVRAADPVRGAHGVALALVREFHSAQTDLAAVQQQLAMWGHAVQHRPPPDAPGFPSAVQPSMPPPLPTIPEAQPATMEAQLDYSSYMPYGVKMDEDVRSMWMEHHTLAAAAPASSSLSRCNSSTPPPCGHLNRKLGLRFTPG